MGSADLKKARRNWALGLLAGAFALLLLCAGMVYWIDPCFYYRWPPHFQPVFFNQRYQDAGLAKNCRADTVLLGTSLVANYRVSQVEQTFGGTAVKLTIPDGYFSEFDETMKTVFRGGTPSRVVFGLDTNILVRDESEKTSTMPDYLYNANPLDDVKYLLNKDTLYYSLYTVMSSRWGTAETVDEAFTWDKTVWWSKQTALAGYQRPDVTKGTLPQDAYFADCDKNLAVLESWITAHPDTEFDVFFPPYSILYWDKMQRTGATDAVFAAVDRAFTALLSYDNVKVYYFPAQTDIITNLDNYGDYIHHSGAVCTKLLQEMKADEYRITPENAKETLAKLRTFVVNYDYESIWRS